MKKLFIVPVCLSVLFVSTSCKDDCVLSDNPICRETVPTEEFCSAYFSGWFFDSEENTCQEIGYSGCTKKGFDSKEECESCQCK